MFQRLQKPFRFRWWQLALYELTLFSLGFGIAGLFPDFAAQSWPYFLLVFVILAPLIVSFYLHQINPPHVDDQDDRPGSE